MAIIEVNRNPSSKDLFWFGVILSVAFAGVGALLRYRFDAATAAWVVWGIGAGALLVFALFPRVRRPFYVGWIYTFFPLGYVLSHIVMAITFYLVLTPIGALSRVFRGDSMCRRFESDATSYWVVRDDPGASASYFRQF